MSNYVANRHNNVGLFSPFFEDFFDEPLFRSTPSNSLMKTDITDEGDHYLVKVDVPEVKKEDIKLSLNDGYLTIAASYNVNNDEKDKKGKYIHRERYYGSFNRSFYVGDNIKEEDVHAKLENGVLSLNIKKVSEPEKKPNTYIAIE